MDMHLPASVNSLMGDGLLSSHPEVRRQQLSRINAYMKGNRLNAKQKRAQQKALYKSKLFQQSLSPSARLALKHNPMQYGGPRCFKILTAGHEVAKDAKLQDRSRYVDEGHTIFFSAFGVAGKPVRLNQKWIKPDGREISPDKRIYTLTTTDEDEKEVQIYLDFTIIDQPTGYLGMVKGQYALQLEPWAVSFNVSISANAGATFDKNTQALKWDPTSTSWTSATWEKNAMIFSYDTTTIPNPAGGTYLVNEVSYQDTLDPNNVFELNKSEFSMYTAQMTSDAGVILFDVSATGVTPPPAPSVRINNSVKSTFPVHSLFQFDELGTSFTGAYVTSVANQNLVYAVTGVGQEPGAVIPTPGPVLPPAGTKSTVVGSSLLFHSNIKPIPHASAGSGAGNPTPLSVIALLNNDPMVPDPTSPTSYIDSVAKKANADFHDIILYYMDKDLYNLFISATPVVLSSSVLAIATDSTLNKAFYQSLQVPYLVSMLAQTTLSEAKQCNMIRANAQLKDLPTNSPIYQKHSAALYRYHYMDAFKGVQLYLNDQAGTTGNDWSPNIENLAAYITTKVTNMSKDVVAGDPKDGPANLKAALADVISLKNWAIDKKLFYAYDLYNWCCTFFMPNIYAQSANGDLSATVSKTIKKLTTTFGILENGQINPSGKSFQQSFNDLVQVFQMTAIIPQFVDADGNSSEFDSIQKAMLQQFYTDNINSLNMDQVKEALLAQRLAADDQTRQHFFDSLVTSMRLYGSLGAWTSIVSKFGQLNQQAGWYQKLVGGADMATTFLRGTCVVLIVLPMLTGGWDGMSTDQKIVWTTVAAGLALTFFLKGIAAVLTVKTFWSDLGGVADVLKAFAGFKSVLQTLPAAATKTQNSLVQWFVRSSDETMTVVGDEITIGMKIFGRSLGEFLTNCVGAVLAGVNLVMSIIDAVQTTDPLQKTIDAMMIISSGLQLLAIGAGWLVTAEIVTDVTAVAILETVASWTGPFAILFAIIGIIVMLVMIFTQTPPPDPIQVFIDEKADPLGLKMPYGTAIDYFNVVPSDPSVPSLNGISFRNDYNWVPWWKGGDPTSKTAYIQHGAENSAPAGTFPILTGSLVTYLPDTCWCVKTDSTGRTTIYTYATDVTTKTNIYLCLTEMSDGSVQATPPVPATTTDSSGKVVPVDPAKYAAALAMQQWTLNATSSATSTSRTVDGKTTSYVQSASFEIKRGPKSLLLNVSADKTMSWQLTSSVPYSPPWDPVGTIYPPKGLPYKAPMPSNQKTLGTEWTLNLESMGPSDFSYLFSPWNLYTTDTEKTNYANFTATCSSPLNWSVTPAFPAFLQFGDSTLHPGSIIQTPNTVPPVTPATTYTVTASIVIAGRTLSKQTTVTISVVGPTQTATNFEANGIKSGLDTAVSSTVTAPQMAQSGTQKTTNGDDGINSTNSVGKPSENLMAHSLRAGVDGLIAQKYTQLMANAPSIFKWQQDGMENLNEHCTASDAILKMRNSLTGTWQVFNDYSANYEDVYFANRAAAPAHMANDPCDYEGGANAYVVQAIYNGDAYVKPNCNWSNAQNKVNAFNASLMNSNVDLYIAYLQGSQSVAATGGLCSFDLYKSFLVNVDWIAMKAAEQTTGGWPNQTLEMFFHFLKLAAIGATDAQIASIYSSLTAPVTGPKLNASGFALITPTTWRAYRGYISNVAIAVSQVNVTGLNQSKFVQNPYPWTGPGWLTMDADTDFVAVKHYWQVPPPEGCCLQAGALVVLGDGKTIMAVEKVQPGQSVLSPTLQNPLASTTVLWVSRPEQSKRPLYSYRDVPGVSFTATHPVSLGYDEHKQPILGFVDVDTAVRVNPLWAAFTLRQLPSEQLDQHAAPENSGVLYDLVLDQKSANGESVDAPTYVVQSSTGKRLTVCSEAPSIAKLPGMSRFMLSFVQGIGKCHDPKGFFPRGLGAGVLDHYARIKKHRTACAAQALRKDANVDLLTAAPHSLGISTVLSVFSQATLEPQILADSIEVITGYLGLSLQSQLDDGWQHAAAPAPGSPSINILSTHLLQLTHSEMGPISPLAAVAHNTVLATLQKILLSNPQITATVYPTPSIPLNPKTRSQVSDSVSSAVDHRSLGPFLHTARCTLPLPSPSNSVSTSGALDYTFRLTINSSITLQAQGTIFPDIEARWPLHFSVSNAQSSVSSDKDMVAAQGLNVGWISLTYGSVAAEAMKTCESWAIESGDGASISPMERYAEVLGKAVGLDVAETVCGPAK